MNDLFFHRRPPLTLEQAVDLLKTKLGNEFVKAQETSRPKEQETLTGVAALGQASAAQISFVENSNMYAKLAESNAGLLLINERAKNHLPKRGAYIVCDAPRAAFAILANQLYIPKSLAEQKQRIHPTAQIDPSAIIAPTACIGPEAKIGTNAQIGAGCNIGPGVAIGAGSQLISNVSVHCTTVGQNCLIQSGAAIGDPGFAIAAGPKGLVEVPQLGDVIIGDRVIIGSNSNIDRGALGSTRIGDDTKIDNICHIAHNCQIGRSVIITANVAVAGSCVLEDFVQIGGGVSIADHVTIGTGAKIVGHSGLMNNIPPGEIWGGYPARKWYEFKKEVLALRRLTRRKKT